MTGKKYKFRFPNNDNAIISNGRFSGNFYISGDYVYVESDEETIKLVADELGWEKVDSTDFDKTIIALDPELYMFWVHITATGGDGRTPIGILNDGESYMDVHVAIRISKEADADIIPITASFRITIREDSGAIYDVIEIDLEDGKGIYRYTTTYKPGICIIDERDFDPIEINGVEYKVRLVNNPFVFKVYRGKVPIIKPFI